MALNQHLTDLIDSPLHRRWKRDRRLRHRVPAPNDKVRWLALRDVPPGHFPASPPMNRRVVNWASVARAELRYGAPTLDFAHPAQPGWDFGYVPVAPFDLSVDPYGGTRRVEAGPDTLDPDRFPREFAALCALGEAMTDFAFHGLDARGRPVRGPWFARRPRGGRPRRINSLHRAIPRPMLAFRPEQVDQLLWASAGPGGERQQGLPCASCRSGVPMEDLHADGGEGDEPFVARCPCCRRRVRWDPEDVRPCSFPRTPALPCRDAFTDAVSEGLPLLATEPCIYLGASADEVRDADHINRPDLVAHRFRSRVDDREWTVPLPASARLLVTPGHELDPNTRGPGRSRSCRTRRGGDGHGPSGRGIWPMSAVAMRYSRTCGTSGSYSRRSVCRRTRGRSCSRPT